MATFYPVGGGAPGIDPNQLTAVANDVVAGKLAGVQGNYDPVMGTLTLTGNAQLNHVLSGETYYSTNPHDKLTGTMSIQSILSFSCAPYSASQIVFTWQNPYTGPFSGVIIVGKTGGYPADINDGTRYYKGFGNNTGSGGISNEIVGGFSTNITYYFKAFSYATINGEEWLGSTTRIANTIISQTILTFTSSTSWVVPSGVTSIDIFTVGGGGGGGWGDEGLTGKYCGGGGGGGYTTSLLSYSVSEGLNISITVGSGGNSSSNGNSSYVTINSTQMCLANGGQAGYNGYRPSGSLEGRGGDGGCGGGGSAWFSETGDNIAAGNGGSNGSNGTWNVGGGFYGAGQGTTTRAFGESSGTIYSGGGGGGGNLQYGPSYRGYGGVDGGGDGADAFTGGTNGAANTGGGGGGGYGYSGGSGGSGYAGGSGICLIRYTT